MSKLPKMKPKAPRVVVGALIEKDGKYLLIKERLSDKKNYWIVPGGGVEFGESLEEAVIREMKEETGLDIQVTKYLGHKEAIYPNNNYHTVIFFFLAKPIGGELKFEPQILEGEFVSRKNTKNMQLVESARWVFDCVLL